jgi:hypothetical protein
MELIDIDREAGDLIMRHMETALGFPGWTLLGALYDERRRHIQGVFAHDADNSVHHYFLKMREDGKLTGYRRLVMPPEALVKYLAGQVPGFVPTMCQGRIKRFLKRAMTPELALGLVEAGVDLERADRSLPAMDFFPSPDNPE